MEKKLKDISFFVGETVCRRWAIVKNRYLIWGHHFWWLCDCVSIKEILEYEGSTPMIYYWYQELLVYHFSIVYQSNKIMTDVEALTRRFVKFISKYYIVASILIQYKQTAMTARI